MKKITYTLAATVFIAGFLFTSCNSPSQRIENAEENLQDKNESVIEARNDLSQARRDSITEYQQFKTDYQNQIRINEERIAELKVNLVDASQKTKVIYDKKLVDLEEKNNALKIKLAEYREGGENQWQSFKKEFKRDMDELGKAFSDFTENDTKK